MDFETLRLAHNDHRFRVPQELSVSALAPGRVLVIGACLAQGVNSYFHRFSGRPVDYAFVNHVTTLPALSAEAARAYDFQVFLPVLRTVMPEGAYLSLPGDDEAAWRRVFEESCERLRQLTATALRHNSEHGLLTFVGNFMLPQQNSLGRLMPPCRYSNPRYFVGRLNDFLGEELGRYKNAYWLDVEGVAASFGKKYFQDDALCIQNHSAWIFDFDSPLDKNRIEPRPSALEHYGLRSAEFMQALWAELVASWRTVLQADAVKMVVVDLDDTLWRGIAAEGGSPEPFEGWPLGVVEALQYLKKRGILLGILSKNDEAKIRELWGQMTGGRIGLEDFVVRKINWRPKPENMEELLREVNLLAQSVVFVDDNPAERAAMRAAFPAMRVLGDYPYYLRRILLWSAETQVASLTNEAARRTEMIQAQVQREESRKKLSREEFLVTLGLQVRLWRLVDDKAEGFERAFELLNKTNQFNTTGRRWRREELLAEMSGGLALWAFEVRDRYTHYGLVGVALATGNRLRQFVMSCRVLGLEVERAVLAKLLEMFASAGCVEILADFVETPANGPCRELYPQNGFQREEHDWRRSLSERPGVPSHVKMSAPPLNSL